MQTVISKEQARRITGGRTPLVPAEYEAAVTALQKCQTIDDAKYWADKSDALAAWARIYRNDQAGSEAKRLKLHAYRRMGQLAEQLRPRKSIGRSPDGRYVGTMPGPQSLLREHGFNSGEVSAIRRVALTDAHVFNAAVTSPDPPSPTEFMNKTRGGSAIWKVVAGQSGGASLIAFRSFCRKYRARDIAKALAPDEQHKTREMAIEVGDWIDELIERLPRTGK